MNEEFEIVMETGDAFGNEDGKPEKLKSKLKNIQNVKFITDEVIKPKEVKEKPIPKKNKGVKVRIPVKIQIIDK